MKKKNLILTLAVGALAGTMLTGCGGKEVTKVDESAAVISEVETNEEPTETVEPTATVGPTEQIIEAVEPTEAVVDDFLARNDLTITRQGNMELMLTLRDSDEVEAMKSNVTVTVVNSDEEGYVDTMAVFEITLNSSLHYWVSAFDRYTGTCFESNLGVFETNENATQHDDVCVIDIDGQQYDCGLTASQEVTDNITTVSLTVHHPKEYDGAVFQFGTCTSIQSAVADTINYDEAFTVDMYPELLEGQYFFTATNE